MAAKTKKVAKRDSTKSPRPQVETGIPDGFTMPASANTPFHDFTKHPTLNGTRITVREINRKKPKKGEKKTMQLMTIRAADGTLVAVSDSHALLGLFDESKNGAEVFIRFDGQKKIEGGRKVNLFTTAFKNLPGTEGSRAAAKKKKPF